MEITEGYFGDVRLDGLRVAGVYHWPGPVHECGGTWWSIIDKSASEEQVAALFTIFGGEEQEPTTGFAIYGATIEHEPDPPKKFTQFHITWHFKGEGLDQDKLLKAIATAEHKYCSVSASLKDDIVVKHTLTVEEVAVA